MKEKELLIGLSYIDRKYIEESEMALPSRKRALFGRKKVWLIAAVIVLILALAGCAAVVYSRIQMKVVQHYVPTTAPVTNTVGPSAPETLPAKDVLTGCYPQSLPAGYQMGEGEQTSRHSRRIEYRNEDGGFIFFSISTYASADIALAPPVEKTSVSVSGNEAVLQVTELGAQALTWHNEAEGYYASLFTEDMEVALHALAESVDFGEALPLTFLCRDGKVWNTWYPQQLPEGYVCISAAPFSDGTQTIDYSKDGEGITYAVSLTKDFLAEATEPPHDPFTWEDVTVAGQPARMMTTQAQRMLYWHDPQEGFHAMLIVSDGDVDILSLAESVGPGEPVEITFEYLGPDYTIELEQEKTAYVAWEPVYPQWVPEGYEITFVGEPAYGQQIIHYENEAGEPLLYTLYFRLGQWGRDFEGMGQPEQVTINGNVGYRLGSQLLWTDEAKGFGFTLAGAPGTDLVAIAESVGPGPELEPTNAHRTQKALAELGDYRITALPEGIVEDAVTGMPIEDGGGWYSYVRRWYIDPNTNAQIYLEYESYAAAADQQDVTLEEIAKARIGDIPMELCTIQGCTGAVSQNGEYAKAVWIVGEETKGVSFSLYSTDFTARELLEMAQSVRKQ